MIHGYLVLQKRNGTDGPLFPVKRDLKIGRGTQCDVRIHVQSVSNQHCQILVGASKKAHILNLSSSAQTLVNGVSVGQKEFQLKNKDIITVGERSFRWYSGHQKPSNEDLKLSLKKRRKSEADSIVGSHNIAIVNPLYHKRRTLGPTATWPSVRSPVDIKNGSTRFPSDKTAQTSARTPSAGNPSVKTPLAKSHVSRTLSAVGVVITPESKSPGVRTSSSPSTAKTPAARTPKMLPKTKTPSAKTPTIKSPLSKTPVVKTPAAKSPQAKSPLAKTPRSKTPAIKSPLAKTPAAKTPVAKFPAARTPPIKSPLAKTPRSKTPAIKSPLAKIPAAKTPVAKSPAARTPPIKSPLAKTPRTKTPAIKSPLAKTPAARTPPINSPLAKTPRTKTPAAKSPVIKSPLAKTPAAKSPAARSPPIKSPLAKTPRTKTPAAKSPAIKSPLAKTPAAKSPAARTPGSKTPAKTPKAKTPAGKSSTIKNRRSLKTPITPKSAKLLVVKKSKSAVISLKKSKAQKRRLSSPCSVVPKRVKIESPKSIDKKKMAALSGIHRKSLTVMSSSTLSNVRVILSSKKTPIIKTIKTPGTNTMKKANRRTPGQDLLSSAKKPRRPLFSEILKKKAVQKANAAAKKLMLVPQDPPKPLKAKVKKTIMSTKIPVKFSFTSTTGHANSPESIFIGRKVVKTPAVTRKGRKDPIPFLHKTSKENVDLSGFTEMFKTPGKGEAQTSSLKKIGKFASSSKKSLGTSPAPSPLKSKTPEGTMKNKRNSIGTPVKVSIGSPITKSKGSSSRRGSSALPSSKGTSPISSPTSKPCVQPSRRSSSKKHPSVVTSTPATFSKRKLSVGSTVESPSFLSTGYTSAPQSPPSGRKSRLGSVSQKSSYVHSPQASPVKSSLKSSPPGSPQSSGHGKSLSVSFNDNIHIQMLVPGSKRGPNTTALLGSPISPSSEGRRSAGTPDLTSFDFNSIKTPNVPKEMFVSSILSSGTSSNGQASGSAKRKGRTPSSPRSNDTNMQVRRLLKSSSSPAGYVDVKGIKRLMAASCKTPTYLAVEGVKKLFGDAAASAGNELSNFAGVRELFASPSPKIRSPGRLSNKMSPEVTTPSKKSSPVAKIQAEVEGKKAPTFTPPAVKSRSPKSSPLSHPSNGRLSSTTKQSRNVGVSPNKSSSAETASRNATPKAKKAASPRLSSAAVEQETRPKRTRGAKRLPAKGTPSKEMKSPSGKIKSPVVELPTRKRSRKAPKVWSPSAEETTLPTVKSPPKRKTRRNVKSSEPVDVSPPKALPTTRRGRGAKVASPTLSASSPSTNRPSLRATKEVKKTTPTKETTTTTKSKSRRVQSVSPVLPEKNSPVKVTLKKIPSRQVLVNESPSPAKEPLKRGRTRQTAKLLTAAPSSSPAKAKSSKRALSPSKTGPESPAKKSRMDVNELSSPKVSPQGRTTRRTRKGTTSKPQRASPELVVSTKKKSVSFDDQVVTPQKRGKATVSQKRGNAAVEKESFDASPLRSKRAKKTDRDESKQSSKGENTKKTTKKPASPSLSPRRTRSRK